MIITPVTPEAKNHANFDISFVKAIARAAKTNVRPGDNMAKLMTDDKFMQRLLREFLQKRLNITLDAKVFEAFEQSGLAKTAKSIGNRAKVDINSFVEKCKARQKFNGETFKSGVLDWLKRVGDKTIKSVRAQQSELITEALSNTKGTFEKLKHATVINEINVFQKTLHRNLTNSQFSLGLKKADYAKHPSAKNKYYLEIAEEQLQEIKAITKEAQKVVKAKKAEIIKTQEGKLRNHLIVFLKRTDSKRTRMFSDKDLKAMTISNDPMLKHFAEKLIEARAS